MPFTQPLSQDLETVIDTYQSVAWWEASLWRHVTRFLRPNCKENMTSLFVEFGNCHFLLRHRLRLTLRHGSTRHPQLIETNHVFFSTTWRAFLWKTCVLATLVNYRSFPSKTLYSHTRYNHWKRSKKLSATNFCRDNGPKNIHPNFFAMGSP